MATTQKKQSPRKADTDSSKKHSPIKAEAPEAGTQATHTRRIALDPGFGGIKIAEVRDGEMQTHLIPAVVGVGRTDAGLLEVGLGKTRKASAPVHITFEGFDYLVGANLFGYARPLERLDMNRLTDALELRALIYAALHRAIDGGEHEIDLVVGLPVQVLDAPDAKETVAAIRAWLVGEHQFSVGGQAAKVAIRQVIFRAQPLGAFFEWSLDLRGEWTRSAADTKANVAVADIGFNTLDLFGLTNGRVATSFTAGDTLGMRRAVASLQDSIKRKHRRSLTLHEVDELIQAYHANGRKVTLNVGRGESVEIGGLIKQCVNPAATEIVANISNLWGDGAQFDYVLLTGGGAHVFGNELRRMMPQVIQLPDPVTANARGLARYAQRAGVFKG